mgnify:CR=1 FL=1
MLYRLSELVHTWGPFRLFEYISVRAILAGVTALLLGMLFSGRLIAVLARLRQPERSAKLMGELAKEGGKVPTMGGLIIAVAMIPSVLLWARLNVLVLAALWCLVGMGLVGLYDDWLKVRHGSSDGISARLKLATAGQREFTTAQAALFDIAQRIGVPIQETATLYGKLQQAVRMLGGEQKDALTITESISQALRLSGASATEACRASSASA